jgi:hypothetical protein
MLRVALFIILTVSGPHPAKERHGGKGCARRELVGEFAMKKADER